MEIILLQIGLFIASYLIGSIPSGIIVSKVFMGIDLREHGSKNIGTSNAIRVMGIKLGILVFLLDALKGALPILLVRLMGHLVGDMSTYITIFNQSFNYEILFGVTAILGHTFPLYIGFKGGKAVAASCGVVLVLTPIPGVLCILAYIIVVAITKYASLGSTIAALVVLISTLVQLLVQGRLYEEMFMFVFYTLLVIFIFVRHKDNYKRLLNGTENKMSFKKKS
ncbi:Glycerol-3-phosphate acyltransferase [Paracholeplasma brassicae]|uniref:Glycerol-3-phosphate acyltransferase n=1 Tax=Acholeplasma brassicae TaxID=61635 RepID=U4KNP5_9MOLU|nr:glycerol-3-phosphate 1-O-acyltransferase PlsY [Paracholeplasma brassicae]CCV65901.1 Glycerol-3-phosphate acyltransferase [Paracholeplasma brassicae]